MSVVVEVSIESLRDSLGELSGHTFAEWANDGLTPGGRVIVDDDVRNTATICWVDSTRPYVRIRVDQTGDVVRVSSWRLAVLHP